MPRLMRFSSVSTPRTCTSTSSPLLNILFGLAERFDQEIDVLGRAFDEFRSLFARQIIEDELLWRELTVRFSDYFEGGMGADAIKRLIDRIDLDEEEQKLRRLIEPTEGVKPLSAQRKQKAIKRLKIVAAFNRRDENAKRVNDPRAIRRRSHLR